MNSDSKPTWSTRPERSVKQSADGSLWRCAVLCCQIAGKFLFLCFIEVRFRIREFLFDTRDLFLLALGYEYEDSSQCYQAQADNPQRENVFCAEKPIASRLAERECGNNAVSNNATNNIVDNLPRTVLPIHSPKEQQTVIPNKPKPQPVGDG
jgi:hypothetical protein